MKRSLPSLFLLVLLLAILGGCSGDPGERAWRRGLQALDEGKYGRAKAELEKAVEARPGRSKENATALNALGLAHWHLGELTQAKAVFERSRTLDPDLAAPVINLALMAEEGGEPAVAEMYLREASLLPDPAAAAPAFLGHHYLDSGRWQEARRALLEAHERAPASPSILTALGVAALHLDGARDAVLYNMQALESDPEYLPALYNLAMLHADHLNDPEHAKAYYQQYVDLAGEGDRKAKALAYLANPVASGTDRRTPPSAPQYDALQDTARKKVEVGAVDEALNMLLMAAARAARANDTEHREQMLGAALELCFDQGRAHYAWGQYMTEQQRWTEARQAFEKAVALQAGYKEAYLALAAVARAQGEPEAAIAALRTLVRSHPRDVDARWALASWLDASGEGSKALSAYQEFRRLFPDDPRAAKASDRIRVLAPADMPPGRERESAPPPPPPVRHGAPGASSTADTGSPSSEASSDAGARAFRRAVTYHRQQDWDRAQYYYQRTVDLDPSRQQALYNLGLVFTAQGLSAKAQKAYRQVLSKDPAMSKARFNLALLLFKDGRLTETEQELKALLAVDEGYAQAHNLLGILYGRQPGKEPLARRHFQRFVDLAPNDPAAQAARSWLASH